jgi:hypothetical protein
MSDQIIQELKADLKEFDELGYCAMNPEHVRTLIKENERLKIAVHIDTSLGNTVCEMHTEIERRGESGRRCLCKWGLN